VRVVLDTNVLFAAFRLGSGFCHDLFRHCILRHEIVTSEHILDELRRHLTGKGKLTTEKINEVIEGLRSASTVVQPAIVPAHTCRDPDDLAVLGTAIVSQASVLVTGDNDLLTLHPFTNIAILSPRAFHTQYVLSNL